MRVDDRRGFFRCGSVVVVCTLFIVMVIMSVVAVAVIVVMIRVQYTAPAKVSHEDHVSWMPTSLDGGQDKVVAVSECRVDNRGQFKLKACAQRDVVWSGDQREVDERHNVSKPHGLVA